MADAGAAPATAGPATEAAAAVAARREIVLAVVTIVALSRLADGSALWAVGLLAALAIGVGTMHALGGARVDAALVPAVAAFACVGAIRLVPLGLALVPALLAAALLLDRTIASEGRLAGVRAGPSEGDRGRLLTETLVVAFLAFLGTAALVPGGLPEPGTAAGAAGAPPLSEANLLLLAGVDALIAGLLGYRTAALRLASPRAAAWSAATYASAIAIAAAALRATDIPRLIGPAMLTLVFFLWDAFHAAPPARRRDPRWMWQIALLVGLGVIVIVWNLGLR